jgi:hypothetical protein
MMKKASRHEEAMAKKPRTTMTAMAQWGKPESEEEGCREPVLPEVEVDDDDAPALEAAEAEEANDEEADAREAEAALEEEADAADAEDADILDKMEFGKVV